LVAASPVDAKLPSHQNRSQVVAQRLLMCRVALAKQGYRNSMF
jgi:hypothetical protein